jgi:predicted peroxiredoxin
MKKLVFLFVITTFMLGCTNSVEKDKAAEAGEPMQQENVTDGMFIHITESYDDAHRVLMPMKMATLMAEDKDVLVYLDIDAVELVVKDAEDLNHEHFDSFQTYLKKLNEMNVGVYACPSCLKVAGFQPEDLVEGVETASKEKFFNFTKGNIITLDY